MFGSIVYVKQNHIQYTKTTYENAKYSAAKYSASYSIYTSIPACTNRKRNQPCTALTISTSLSNSLYYMKSNIKEIWVLCKLLLN